MAHAVFGHHVRTAPGGEGNRLAGIGRPDPHLPNAGYVIGKGTFAWARGSGQDAPIADLHSTRAWGMTLSGSYAASLCLCIGLQLASSLIILCAPRVREPVGVIERG